MSGALLQRLRAGGRRPATSCVLLALPPSNDRIRIMGKLLYGTPPTEHDIEDRLLSHLQVVIVTKFRRNESFAFHIPGDSGAGTGRQTVWLHPTIPVQFSFLGSRVPAMNPTWVQQLLNEANSGRGLSIMREPQQREAVLRDVTAA